MPIIRWRPFHEMEELFDKPFSATHWDLAVDVYCEKDNVIAKMHIPGIDPEDIEIEVEENHLHVYGSREQEEEEEKKEYYRKEIKRGSFERIIDLPCDVVADKTTAEFEDGTLIITMPKETHGKEAQKIKVVKK